MKELTPPQFHRIAHLFTIDIPNYPVVQAVIEGNNPGKIWVNDLEQPTLALVRTNGSYSFISDDTITQYAPEICEILKSHKPIKLVNKLIDHLSLVEKHGFTPISRIQFQYPAHNLERIKTYISQIPSDCKIQRINETLFKQCNWHDYLVLFYGTTENYLDKGFGFCLTKDDLIISEAHACYIGGGMAEIGSVTHENYQNKGLSSIVCSYLIQECFARNLIPIWSCNEINIASATVAQKLGFEEKIHYQFLTLAE